MSHLPVQLNCDSFLLEQQSLSTERTFPQFKALTFMIVIQQLVLVLKVFHDRQIKVLLSIVSSNLIEELKMADEMETIKWRPSKSTPSLQHSSNVGSPHIQSS